MSDTNNPKRARKEGSSKTPSGQEKKSRSPVERAIVWGLIGVLLIVLGIEALADRSCRGALDKLDDVRALSEQQNTYTVTEAMVAEALGGKKPSASESIPEIGATGKTDVYVWWGVLKNRRLYVRYGISGVKGEPEMISHSMSKEESSATPRIPSLDSTNIKPTESEPKQEPADSESKQEPVESKP